MVAATGVETLEVLIIGSPATGKSTFVKTICNSSAMGNGGAAGWLFGRLIVDDTLHMRFIEPPQVPEFDFMWLRELIEHADVPVFLVLCDSTMPPLFGETVGILESIRSFHPDTPCLLATNKQDVPGAWGPEDIRTGLGIPDEIPVVPCVAHDRNSVKEVVLQLLYLVFRE